MWLLSSIEGEIEIRTIFLLYIFSKTGSKDTHYIKPCYTMFVKFTMQSENLMGWERK